MKIPPDALNPDTLRALIDEYVTRDGTELSDADRKVEQVLGAIQAGRAEIHYDEDTGSTTIIKVKG